MGAWHTERTSAFVGDRVKFFLTFSLITVQNLVVVSYTMYTLLGVPKFWGTLRPHPFGWGVADP